MGSYILTHIIINITQRNLIYFEYQYNSWLGRENSLLQVINACMHLKCWRTELTSPAIKSFMTLQCYGPHSARPASNNLCLQSDSKHTHTVRVILLSPALKSASANNNYKYSSRQAHTFKNTQSVSIYLFVSPCSCSIHLYTLLPSVAASICKICLNLILALIVSSAQHFPHY